MLELPYLDIDNEIDLNSSILILILEVLATNNKGNYKLDFSKLQVLLYLVKNPSKINRTLELAGKKFIYLEDRYTYTVQSESVNVDILFDKKKLRTLLQYIANKGLLKAHEVQPGQICFSLSNAGAELSNTLTTDYFHSIRILIKNLSALQSTSSTRLFSITSQLFKGY